MQKQTGEQQYLSVLSDIYHNGIDIYNDRTGKFCRTLINADLQYDVGEGEFPLVTTREANWKIAIAELLGYIRGYSSAEDFRRLGTKTWDANANSNKEWLANPNRKGEDDMGLVYGVLARTWPVLDIDVRKGCGSGLYVKDRIDLIKKVYDNLKKGIDDRGEVITFWNPGMFNLGCLRPCMHTHTFSLLGDTLHLSSYQRSSDFALGKVANMVQCYTFLALMAQITGHKAGIAYHKNVNIHLYQDQLRNVPEQLSRRPFAPPKLNINPDIKTLKDLETWVTLDDFEVVDYQCHPAIKYPFSV